MDVTRLYNLTTPELRVEAERLGVRDTYAMSRGQLIHAIRNQSGEVQPEGLLGKVLGFAKWAIQTTASVAPKAEDENATTPRRQSEVPIPSVGPTSEPQAAASTPSDSGIASEATETSETGPGPASEGAAALGPASASETAAVTAPMSEDEGEGWAVSGSSSRPPAGVFSRGISSFEEPFPTRTMARILADQGHFRRSLAIYAKLLEEHPRDPELGAEAEEVRSRSRARRSELP